MIRVAILGLMVGDGRYDVTDVAAVEVSAEAVRLRDDGTLEAAEYGEATLEATYGPRSLSVSTSKSSVSQLD